MLLVQLKPKSLDSTMDHAEAKLLLEKELQRYRSQSHQSLQRLLDAQDVVEIKGPSGATYQIEVQAFWDDRPGGPLRILGNIDDGGWRAFSPLSDGFLVPPR